MKIIVKLLRILKKIIHRILVFFKIKYILPYRTVNIEELDLYKVVTREIPFFSHLNINFLSNSAENDEIKQDFQKSLPLNENIKVTIIEKLLITSPSTRVLKDELLVDGIYAANHIRYLNVFKKGYSQYINYTNAKLGNKKNNLISLKKPLGYKKQYMTVNEAIILISDSSSNYFHWITEILFRIEYIEKLDIPCNNILINSLNKEFQSETLKTFRNKYNFIELKKETIHVGKAYLIHNVEFPGIANYYNSKFINNMAIKFIFDPPLFSKKIIINRKEKNGRNILNIDETFNRLKMYGFQLYYMEDLSFQAQVNLFKNAEIIISPHGAALTNLFFASEGITLIELFNFQYINSCFYNLSLQKRINYNIFIDHHDYKHGKNNQIFLNLNSIISSLNLS